MILDKCKACFDDNCETADDTWEDPDRCIKETIWHTRRGLKKKTIKLSFQEFVTPRKEKLCVGCPAISDGGSYCNIFQELREFNQQYQLYRRLKACIDYKD